MSPLIYFVSFEVRVVSVGKGRFFILKSSSLNKRTVSETLVTIPHKQIYPILLYILRKQYKGEMKDPKLSVSVLP